MELFDLVFILAIFPTFGTWYVLRPKLGNQRHPITKFVVTGITVVFVPLAILMPSAATVIPLLLWNVVLYFWMDWY